MMKFMRALMFCLFMLPLFVAGAPTEDNASDTTVVDLKALLTKMDTFKYQQSGKVKLGDVATLEIPEGFKFLDGPQAASVLHNVWKNPYAPSLGMLMPADKSPFLGDCWAVDITYEEDGHVKDDDAKDLKYYELLEQMKKQVLESNDERVKQGGRAMELTGWAEPPTYDAASHKLFWAKKLRELGDTMEGLNYNIRILGRKGVLVLNAIGGLDQLGEIKVQTKPILAATNFTAGNQYGDFNSSMDKVAAYGIVGLIAGGVLAKTGLLAKIGILLLKFLKPLIVGVGAIGASVIRFFKGKKDEDKA
jgi:uncharacterized membrane-anchored protein